MSVPLIGELTTEQYRQKLAGLLDPQANLAAEDREAIRSTAIRFAAALPSVFGESLDRLAMWERIGTALQTANAKTAAGDVGYFVQQALEHVRANPAAAASNEDIAGVLSDAESWSDTERQELVAYFGSHLVPILVKAKARWGDIKEERKEKRVAKDTEAGAKRREAKNKAIREANDALIPPVAADEKDLFL